MKILFNLELKKAQNILINSRDISYSQYDKFAEMFAVTRKNLIWNECNEFLKYVSPQDRLLDLGCGSGRFRENLKKINFRTGNYFGLDVSEKLINIAKKNYPDEHFFIGNFAEPLRFGAENFEIVTAVASFHHLLTKQKQKQFLSECWRVLKKNGYIFITTWKLPQKYFWQNFWKGRLKNWIIPFGKEKHPRTYRKISLSELNSLLKNAGFRVIENYCASEKNNVIIGLKE